MTDLYLRKVRGGLAPADAEAEATLQKIKFGDVIKASVRRPRSYQQHKLFFALLAKVVDNTDAWPNTDALLQAIKIALGHFDSVQLVDGTIVPHPRSISLASLARDDFDRFFNDSVELVITRIIPGLDRGDLLQEIHEMVGAD